ncbi:DUF6493 family protein [Streptomyces sp. NBC_01216]|uniref:DUF6493 family protein n=1 Tax=Streptomyces sp. NBC_01216 TaxID=2903778 RepID=UPI002E155103|nr:DUF6493 family protein [Streptomyces sp. NBC_01216]
MNGTGNEKGAALLKAVAAGDPAAVPALLAGMDDGERRSCLPALREIERGWKDGSGSWDFGVARALSLAGAGCHSGVAACAAWLGRDSPGVFRGDLGLLREVLEVRTPEFRGGLAERVASAPEVPGALYGLVVGLAASAGRPVPVTQAMAVAWVDAVWSAMTDANGARWVTYHAGGAVGERPVDRPMLSWLRQDPMTPVWAPLLLEGPGVADRLGWESVVGRDPLVEWDATFARLAVEGVLNRAVLVDAAVDGLAHARPPAPDVRFRLALLKALDPTGQEHAARVGAWTRVAAEGPSPVAGLAQETLRGLWDEGGMGLDALRELSGWVLARPEKKLVRAQLSWIDKALAREPEAAGELLPVAADAFAFPDTTLQERAVRVAGRHLKHADEATRTALGTAAAALGPGVTPLAARLLGCPEPPDAGAGPDSDLGGSSGPPSGAGAGARQEGSGGRVPRRDALPPVPDASPIPAPVADLSEFAAGFAAAVIADVRGAGRSMRFGRISARETAGTDDPASFAWALDGLMRFAHRDRKALAEALEDVARRYREDFPHPASVPTDPTVTLLVPMVAAMGRVTPEQVRRAHAAREDERCVDARLCAAWHDWVFEVAERLAGDPVPLLLATPTRASGELEAEELLERLRTLREHGARAGRADLGLALLRLRHPAAPEAARAEALALGTPEGERLAAWLAAGPLPPWTAERERRAVPSWRGTAAELTVIVSPGRADLAGLLPELPRLGAEYEPSKPYRFRCSRVPAHWVTMLPGQPEAVAAHLVPALAEAASGDEEQPVTRLLPLLAQAPGPTGAATRLALAHGLGVRRAPDRLAVVDALLTLASRGRLDASGLGADLAGLIARGEVGPARVAAALETAATGAPVTVWSVLSSALPPLLAVGTPSRGLAALLAVAAECAEHGGVRAGMPGLAELAARRGSSRTVVEARRLHRALGAGA